MPDRHNYKRQRMQHPSLPHRGPEQTKHPASSQFDILHSPLNVGMIPGDVVTNPNIPPNMPPKKGLDGWMPREDGFSGGGYGKRGRRR